MNTWNEAELSSTGVWNHVVVWYINDGHIRIETRWVKVPNIPQRQLAAKTKGGGFGV